MTELTGVCRCLSAASEIHSALNGTFEQLRGKIFALIIIELAV